jgi:hypothetical protein
MKIASCSKLTTSFYLLIISVYGFFGSDDLAQYSTVRAT